MLGILLGVPLTGTMCQRHIPVVDTTLQIPLAEAAEEYHMRRSTFQLVVASGVQGTYTIFAYDRISNDKAQIAIVAPEPPRSVVAHVSGMNASVMRETSNIGIAGKWIYRINDKTVIPCPAGLIGAPYCLKGM
uniref:NIDO domain-containing protein n=1 Tax=Romanomermis culicivorax TaxID=13658 RepID=A0A915L293_ROMCU